MVPGYGVFITQKQLDEAIANSTTATKLIRNLISVYFEPRVLAASSALGSRLNPALKKEILDACFRKYNILRNVSPNLYFVMLTYTGFVQQQYKVPRTNLVDAVNDKCAQCRRKKTK